ncbi:MAG: hypothetical protein M0R80_00485 [Proteobacteria bacterium]|jgi:hypothetical protein|nr:hypothetical protein [Pseudomonadota bacterium]
MSSSLEGAKTLLAVAALAASLAIATGCNSTPTVPVPPPEFCGLTPPNADGIVVASCEAGQTARNIALVFNDEQGRGVMQETEADGTFSVEIAAAVGDPIIFQIMYDDRLSAEVYLEVPAE